MRLSVILVVLVALTTNLAFAQFFQIFTEDAEISGFQVLSYNGDAGTLYQEVGFSDSPYFQNNPANNLAAYDYDNFIFFGSNGVSVLYRADVSANQVLPPWTISGTSGLQPTITYLKWDNKYGNIIAVIAPDVNNVLLLTIGPSTSDNPTMTVARSFNGGPGGPNNFGFDVSNQLFYWITDELVNATFSYMHLHWISMAKPTQEQHVKSCGDPARRSEIFIDDNNGQPFLFTWHPSDPLYGILRLDKKGNCRKIVKKAPSLITSPVITYNGKRRTVYAMWQNPKSGLYTIMGVNIDTGAMQSNKTISYNPTSIPLGMTPY